MVSLSAAGMCQRCGRPHGVRVPYRPTVPTQGSKRACEANAFTFAELPLQRSMRITEGSRQRPQSPERSRSRLQGDPKALLLPRSCDFPCGFSFGAAKLFEIGDLPRPGWLSSQLFSCVCARWMRGRRAPQALPAEISPSLFRSDGSDRHLQASANGFRDAPKWRHAFFRDRVIFRARLCLFDRKPIEAGRVGNVRRRPAIKALRPYPKYAHPRFREPS